MSEGDNEVWWKAEGLSFTEEKQVDHHKWSRQSRADPQPDIKQIHVRTKDGWNYIFADVAGNTEFELKEKRRPDNSRSNDDVVPASVAQYVDSMKDTKRNEQVKLNYAKLVIHPSVGVYEYGDVRPEEINGR